MPTIHVELFAGRTVDQKRALAQALTEATVRTLGGSPDAVDVIFTDVQKHDWASGGQLWSDKAAAAPAPAPKP
jgi:4-oxalocrotonate tautomerase